MQGLHAVRRPCAAVLSLLLSISLLCPPAPGQTAERVTPLVDLFTGTGGHGHTYPGATVPFGMVQLSPDNGRTGWDWCSGYHHSDTAIVGFSHTHLSGTGCADLGDISFMPTGSRATLDETYRSPFSHRQEHAEPGYYSVHLLDHNIHVELTASVRAGFHRYTFAAADSAMIVIDLKRGQDDHATDTRLHIEGPALVTGWRFSRGWAADQKVYFAARFSRPFRAWEAGAGGMLEPGRMEAAGKDAKVLLSFGPGVPGQQILVKVGISSVSTENARKNLDAEIAGWDFDAVRRSASDAWEEELSRVRAETPVRETLRVFYTALYHALLAPTVFNDVDGSYRGADGRIHTAEQSPYYSTYSLWDTYRAAHPLYTLIVPERVNGMMESMLAFTRESGYLPVWQLAANETNTMVGYHAVPPLADAYLKGFRGFDAAEALSAMKKSATRDHQGLRFYTAAVPESSAGLMRQSRVPPGQDSMDQAATAQGPGGRALRERAANGQASGEADSVAQVSRVAAEHARSRERVEPVAVPGYVPADKERESVSKTLEYAVDDFSIARMAEAMGNRDDAAVYAGRAQSYRRLFDSTTGFFRGRRTDGVWVSPFDPRLSTEKQPEYTEGNAWQYLWLVPHDVPGLISLMGGRQRFDAMLDSLFHQSSNLEGTGAPPDVSGLIGLYAHGNEPSHHIAYLYDYCGKPWKTQEMVQRIMREFYRTGPEGLCGNEDCGQMSAWYVFSAMGFYPVTPVGGVYAIGSPAVAKAVIRVGEGKSFTVETRDFSPENIYIQSAHLHGRPLEKPWLTHRDIVSGGTLTLMMGPKPNTAWGAGPEAVPPAVPGQGMR